MEGVDFIQKSLRSRIQINSSNRYAGPNQSTALRAARPHGTAGGSRPQGKAWRDGAWRGVAWCGVSGVACQTLQATAAMAALRARVRVYWVGEVRFPTQPRLAGKGNESNEVMKGFITVVVVPA
jgi:hypothetical protein